MKRPLPSGNQDAAPSADDPAPRVLSRQELARERRRAAYRRAKEWRATDPRHLAAKEAAKEQRRAAYQRIKEQRRATAAADKAKRKAEETRQRSDDRHEKDRELAALVSWMTKGSTAQN